MGKLPLSKYFLHTPLCLTFSDRYLIFKEHKTIILLMRAAMVLSPRIPRFGLELRHEIIVD